MDATTLSYISIIQTNSATSRVSQQDKEDILIPYIQRTVNNLSKDDLKKGTIHKRMRNAIELEVILSRPVRKNEKCHVLRELKGILLYAIISEYLSKLCEMDLLLTYKEDKFADLFPDILIEVNKYNLVLKQFVVMWMIFEIATKEMNIEAHHNKGGFIVAVNLFVDPTAQFTTGSKPVKRTQLCERLFELVTGELPITRTPRSSVVTMPVIVPLPTVHLINGNIVVSSYNTQQQNEIISSDNSNIASSPVLADKEDDDNDDEKCDGEDDDQDGCNHMNDCTNDQCELCETWVEDLFNVVDDGSNSSCMQQENSI